MKSSETTHFGYQTIPATEKTARVSEVFQSVAPRYDMMNDLMSFGLHRYWKQTAIARTGLRPGQQVLDLAGGTGDLSAGLAKRVGKSGSVTLTDINPAMIQQGRLRLIDKGILEPIQFVLSNGECLPFPADTFDCITIAFGLRNITDKALALKEMHRTLKPGGRVVILEFSHPKGKLLTTLYETYSFSVIPMLGKIICQDSESYRYLVESIRKHPSQEELKSSMSAIGFERTEYQNLSGGIVAIHIGFKF